MVLTFFGRNASLAGCHFLESCISALNVRSLDKLVSNLMFAGIPPGSCRFKGQWSISEVRNLINL